MVFSTERLFRSDEIKYKNYRNRFKKIAIEAENLYYKELFDTKTNSIKNSGKILI